MARRFDDNEFSRESGRDRVRHGDGRSRHDRERIAHTAARLIAEHGLTDWALAKRKAARQLMLPESAPFPSNDEIEAALVSYHALYAPKVHEASLRTQREEALVWMKRFAAWDPLLVGGVAAGWATVHSDIRLELVADDAKSVEIALANDNVRYAALPPRADDAGSAAANRDPACVPACRDPHSGRAAQPSAPGRRAAARGGCRRVASRRAEFLARILGEPLARRKREVRKDRVGAGTLERGQHLEHASTLVDPAIGRGGL